MILDTFFFGSLRQFAQKRSEMIFLFDLLKRKFRPLEMILLFQKFPFQHQMTFEKPTNPYDSLI